MVPRYRSIRNSPEDQKALHQVESGEKATEVCRPVRHAASSNAIRRSKVDAKERPT